MNKIRVKLILELKEKGLSRSDIASSRHISRRSVNEVFKRAQELALKYSDIENKSDDDVYRIIFPNKFSNDDIVYTLPDYSKVHSELKRVGVTLRLLWLEYSDKTRMEGGIPYKYTKFCTGYNDYVNKKEFTSHLEQKPGQKCEVDWAGKTMSLYEGDLSRKVYLFVGVLSYSHYTYVEPCLDMKLPTWIRCNVNMFKHFGGVPIRTICDNLKTGVSAHPHEGEIVLQGDYEKLGEHYHTAILPARVKKPKDKAIAEGTVGAITTAITAALRNKKYYTFTELKNDVRVALKNFNERPFTKRDGSRYTEYLAEQPYLQPLPPMDFEICEWKYHVKVQNNSHISYKKNFYSCPFRLIGYEVSVCESSNSNMLRIYVGDELVACHEKFPVWNTNKYRTREEDLPKQAKYVEFNRERIENWSKKIGPKTQEVITRIFKSCTFDEQGYNPCLAVLRLSSKYGGQMLERACDIAISRISTPRYKHINAIIQDQLGEPHSNDSNALFQNQDVKAKGMLRGADYYKSLKEDK